MRMYVYTMGSTLQLPSGFRSFFAMINGVASNTGIEIAMNIVWSWDSAIDSAIPLAVPMKIDENVPAQVGHAMNNPATAPMVLNPFPFLEIMYALTPLPCSMQPSTKQLFAVPN